MNIVDCRNKETDLVKFEALPHFTIFEIPGENGLFIKYDVQGCVINVRAGYAGIIPNTFRITDSDDITDKLWWKVNPYKLVRPLDAELRIKGVKHYD